MSVSPDVVGPVAHPDREVAAAYYRDALATLATYGVDGRTYRAAFERARITYENAKGSALSYRELGDLAYAVRDSLIHGLSAPAPAPATNPATNTTEADGKTVSRVAVARIDAVTSHLARIGARSGAKGSTSDGEGKIDGTDLVAGHFARGTRVARDGEERYAALRADLQAMPTLAAYVAGVGAQVVAEARRDVPTTWGALIVQGDASLVTSDAPTDIAGAPLYLTRTSLGQVADTLGCTRGVAYLWEQADDTIRSVALHRHLVAACVDSAVADRAIILRTALDGGTATDGSPRRVIYGQVGPRYTLCDTPDVLAAVVAALDGEAEHVHVEGDYHLGRGRVTAYWQAETTVDLACEDIFRSGVTIEWDDRGTGSIRIGGCFLRNLCLNLIRIDRAVFEVVNLAHFGGFDELVEAIKRGVRQALAAIQPVLDAYGIARQTTIPAVEVEATDDVPAAILPAGSHEALTACLTSWVQDGTLGLPRRSQADRDRAVQALVAAVAVEDRDLKRPEGFAAYTQADAVNAVTRVAHTADWIGFDAQAEIERLASRLLVQR